MKQKNFDSVENRQNSFAERLKILVEQAGGNAAFARLVRVHGGRVSPGMVGQYLAGHSEPSLSRLVAMAKAGGVRLGWLATGDGPMRPGETGHGGLPTRVNLDLLRACLELVETEQAGPQGALSEQQRAALASKAALVVLLYEQCQLEGHINEDRVRPLLRAIIGGKA